MGRHNYAVSMPSVAPDPDYNLYMLKDGVNIDGIVYYHKKDLPAYLSDAVRKYVEDYLDHLEDKK